MRLEDLVPGGRVEGLVAGEIATLLAVIKHGDDAVEVTVVAGGAPEQRILYRVHEASLRPAAAQRRTFAATANDFKLAAEAQRIILAGLSDPMLAVATSEVRPLPHQIRAVYGELLPRAPLRYLLADDPGAGKTIMAGLYIKELYLRDDVQRCLIVAPGGLVDQWQDELAVKFGLHFDLLTGATIDASPHGNVFESHPLLIARMDQLSRNPDLLADLAASNWDLVVVDEAHRMGAHYFGAKVHKTKRFLLGELLESITRHLLLMTATPHTGNEADFQLFLTLLDRDRFEGRRTSRVDTADVMRHLVKEDLLTFEGRPLFPERIAETVPYQLTAAEYDLYDRVTGYVRDGMNRAERLDGKRRNTVGFALTVLQRRLASSPEAIYQSLVRRSKRLQDKRLQLVEGRSIEPEPTVDVDDLDADDYTADEVEALEEELLDAATASSTIAELDVELGQLAELTEAARQMRDRGTDRKWTELSTIVQHNVLAHADDTPRKLIVFTEHRDTLNYLTDRIGSLIGRPGAVVAIHGGVSRRNRRQLTEEFSKNPICQILVATDAAGEGLNLQAAHLMVNYDLPWNPNRIEQRFGRIHRIGQNEVCRLWNLVAANTREGHVFERLLAKVEQQRLAYGGRVFDVLGAAFTEVPLRTLLREAIQYGERPEVRARLDAVIDRTVGDGLPELLDERALASDGLAQADVATLRAAMDEARARRLQPHYIELAFREAFTRLGGRLARREPGRFEIGHVPASLRTTAERTNRGAGRAHRPIATRYDRVTFDLDHLQPDGLTRADLLAPGHPLHDVVLDRTQSSLAPALQAGTVLVSRTLTEPRLLVGVLEEVVDGTGEPHLARRFGFAYVDEAGQVTPAGPAPHLDCDGAPPGAAQEALPTLPWLATAEQAAVSWIIAHQLPDFLAELQARRGTELARLRRLVGQRLRGERERLAMDAAVAAEKERAGVKPRESSESLTRKAADLDARLVRRLELIDRQAQLSTRPPRILTAAVVLPESMLADDLPGLRHARETKAVERRGVELVLASERALGRVPVEQPFNNPGFDILSTDSRADTYRIEVKARIEGATDFFVTHSEVILGRNAAPRYRLALVRVSEHGPAHDQVVYLDDPFAGVDLGGFDVVGHTGNWARTWAKGRPPF